MCIIQNGLTITVIVISIAAVAILFIPSQVLAAKQISGDLSTITAHMYTVTLNNFFVNHTRSHSMDTDYVSMGAQSACDRVNCLVGGINPIRTATFFYRDVACCGQHEIGLSLGPFFVIDGLRLDYSVLKLWTWGRKSIYDRLSKCRLG